MKKLPVAIIILLGLSLFILSNVSAQTYTEDVSATLPTGTINYALSQVDETLATGDVEFTLLSPGSGLDFGTLVEDLGLHIFLSPTAVGHAIYYAVDVANTEGGMDTSGGDISVNIEFNPPITGNNIGLKSAATVVKTHFIEFDPAALPVLKPVTGDTTILDRVLLDDLDTSPVTINLSELGREDPGKWLRLYIGMNTGEFDGFPPITALDPAGAFGGELVIRVL